jgi:hypothetical protein
LFYFLLYTKFSYYGPPQLLFDSVAIGAVLVVGSNDSDGIWLGDVVIVGSNEIEGVSLGVWWVA